jgi:hypothetical protein
MSALVVAGRPCLSATASAATQFTPPAAMIPQARTDADVVVFLRLAWLVEED